MKKEIISTKIILMVPSISLEQSEKETKKISKNNIFSSIGAIDRDKNDQCENL